MVQLRDELAAYFRAEEWRIIRWALTIYLVLQVPIQLSAWR